MKKSILANILGRVWGVLSNFLFIPLYIKYLGFESYSVISFTLILAGILAILDAGLTATLAREFSRQDKTKEEKIKTYETLQVCYLFVTITALAIIIIFSGIIAKNLNVSSYSAPQISFFLKLVSIDVAFQLLFRFYVGGLFGLDKQMLANVCQIGWGMLRNGGAVILIIFVPTLQIFFIWQSVITILFAILIKYALDKEVFGKNTFNFKLGFEIDSFNEVKKFTGGMFLISLVSALSSQMDKIFISKMLSIENLGYYTLAVSLSSAFLVIVSPFATAVLPQFTSLYSLKAEKEAKLIFNKFSAIVAILVFGFLANMIFFDEMLLWIWTGNKEIAKNAHVYIPIVASAYACLVLQSIPYHVAIANGYTKLNNIMGIISIFILLPGYLIGVKKFGGIGAAYVFLVVQFFSLIIYLFYINRKFIKERIYVTIFFKQITLPLIISFAVAFLFSKIITFNLSNRALLLFWVGLSTFMTLIVNVFLLIPNHEKKRILEGLIKRK